MQSILFQPALRKKYGEEHSRQYYDVWMRQNLNPSRNDALWIVYIHGGAWRDPRITSKSIEPTITKLITNTPGQLDHIFAIASIEYGLSPHPDFPLPPDASEEEVRSRTVKHPMHIQDVQKALDHLNSEFTIGTKGYILVGHSCGATLAFQSLMRDWNRSTDQQIVSPGLSPPMAIVGLAGIYDMPKFSENHKDEQVYQDILTGAFGERSQVWDDASPVNGRFSPLKSGVVIASSLQDGLVEEKQAVSMYKTFKKLNEHWHMSRIFRLRLQGEHDEMWKEGVQLSRAIEATLRIVRGKGVGEFGTLVEHAGEDDTLDQ